ncbi:MAG: hypothetical protein IJU76_14110 [Desulfovibrionaceae bacterium]|nr:hypothetical protein [Desulfovibrionaceae bacterium]
MTVSDSATLLAALTAIEFGKAKIEDIEFTRDFDLCVKMRGSQWDGEVDYKAAEYIIRLQKAFLAAYNSASGQTPLRYNRQPMENLRVKVTIRKGCEELLASLKEIVMALPPDYQVGAVIAIALIGFGAKLVRDWHSDGLDAQTKKNAIDAAKEVIGDATDVIKKSIDAHAETIQHAIASNKEKPHLSYLSSKMKEGDTMQINDGQEYSRAEAQSLFLSTVVPEEIEMQIDEYCIDRDYELIAIDRIADKVTVRVDGKKRLFSLERLPDEDRNTIAKEFARAKIDRQHCPPTAIQLTACFKGGVFTGGYVDGIGARRENSHIFEQARQLSITTAEEDYERAISRMEIRRDG